MLMAIHSLRQKLYALAKKRRSSHQRVTIGLDACMIITVMLISGDAWCLPIQAEDGDRHMRRGVAPGHKTQFTLANSRSQVSVPQAPCNILLKPVLFLSKWRLQICEVCDDWFLLQYQLNMGVLQGFTTFQTTSQKVYGAYSSVEEVSYCTNTYIEQTVESMQFRRSTV